METPELKPCPFCGGEVTIAVTGYKSENCFFVTRGHSKTRKNCKCRVFMESEPYERGDDDLREKVRSDLADAWNRRANDENA